MASMHPIWYHTAPVGRLAVALVLALFLGQALAAPAFAAVEVCSTTCPDDGPGGDCSPACLDCGCCGHVTRILVGGPGTSAPLARSRRDVADGAARLPAWDPQDVFHVPKPQLA
jgi:hypothetical protein